MSLEIVHLYEHAVDHPGVVEPARCRVAAPRCVLGLWYSLLGVASIDLASGLDFCMPDRAVLHLVPLTALRESERLREPVDGPRGVLVGHHREDSLGHGARTS